VDLGSAGHRKGRLAVDEYIEQNRFPPLSRRELRDSILAGV
jgi:hypothetical protein